MNEDTPLTNAMIRKQCGLMVSPEGARTIERELNEAKQTVHEAQFGKYGSIALSQERDAWKACAETLAWCHGTIDVRLTRMALSEFERLKGKQ